jgi:hypothetical protein
VGLYLLLMIVPFSAPPIDYTTLDGGWHAVTDELAFTRAGAELISTTGPLGFLRCNDYGPRTHLWSIAWGLLLAAALMVAFVRLFGDRPWPALATGATILLLMPFLVIQVPRELVLVLPFVFLFLEADEQSNRLTMVRLLFCVLLAINGWVIFTHLVSGTLAVLAATGLALLRHRRPGWLLPLYLGSLLLLWIATGNRLGELGFYFRSRFEVVAGYGEVMARTGGWPSAGASALLFLGVLAVLVFARRGEQRRLTTWWLVLAASPLFFIAFKAAFTRNTYSRSMQLATLLLLLAGIAAVRARFWRRPRVRHAWTAAPIAASLALWVYFAASGPSEDLERIQLPKTRIVQLASLLKDDESSAWRDHQRRSQAVARYQLPSLEEPVDWYGDLPGVLIAHHLELGLRPVFQRYDAYTPWLAQRNARFYRSEAAPPTVVAHLKPFLDYPPTLLDASALVALLENYRSRTRHGQLVLFERRPKPRRFAQPLLMKTQARFGKWLSLEGHGEEMALWVTVDVEHTPWGRAAKTLYKLPPLHLDVTFADGRHQRFRFAATPAHSGFLLSPWIDEARDLHRFSRRGLAEAEPSQIVTDLRLVRPQGWSAAWEKKVRVRVFGLIPKAKLARQREEVDGAGSPEPPE